MVWSFGFLSVLLPTVAAFGLFLSSRMVCNSMERACDVKHVQALLGDARRLKCFFNVLPVRSFQREKNVSPVRRSSICSVVIAATRCQ